MLEEEAVVAAGAAAARGGGTPFVALPAEGCDRNLNGALKGPSARFVFGAFTLVVQGLMSWDGGATQLSTHNLRVIGGWQAAELGLLMAMDRIGVVLTGSVWSAAFTKCDAKPLLVLGVFSKALSCFLFGALEWKWSMLIAKFFMGVWEGLFAVWATTWVGQRAPKGRKEEWQNCLSIAAAVGNGAGGFTAGLLSAHYARAFLFQAFMLSVIWIGMAFLPGRCFELDGGRDRNQPDSPHSPKSPAVPHMNQLKDQVYPPNEVLSYWRVPSRKSSSRQMLKGGIKWFWVESCALVRGTPLWLHTAMSFSLCFFITTGVTSLWQNTMVSVWGFTDWQATLTFQAVAVSGGAPGVLLGPKWINARTGPDKPLEDPQKRVACLAICVWATVAAACCSTLGALILMLKIAVMVDYNIPQQAFGVILPSLFVLVTLLFFFINAIQGFFIETNRTSVEEHRQSLAIGLTLNCQSLFGYALGALLPGVFTTFFGNLLRYTWPMLSGGVVIGAEFTSGMCLVLLNAWTLCLFTRRAHWAALQQLTMNGPQSSGTCSPPAAAPAH